MSSLAQTIAKIGPLDARALEAARARQDTLTKPLGSLGRLEELSIQVAGIQGKALPQIKNKAIFTMAADHGVVDEGVSLYPQEVTALMVLNFLRGGAGVNVLGRHVGARVIVVDIGVKAPLPVDPKLVNKRIAPGTANMAKGPAMTRAQATQALETGIALVEAELKRGLDIIGTGDMGIGNTTASTAIAAVFTGKPVDKLVGRGTGIGDEQLKHKADVIRQALAVNKPNAKDGLDVLSKVGGFEIGGLAGVMLAGAVNHVPVVIDGFISGAAALVGCALCPQLKDYLIASHMSAEYGHIEMLNYLGLKPVLNLGLRLGEGTGGALAISLVEASTKILSEMATFSEAGVSEANE